MSETRIDYEAVARGLARALVLRIGISREIEGWLTALDEIAEGLEDRVVAEERRLIADAWERERADRLMRGVCLDCDYGQPHHDPRCPRYHDAAEAMERR